MKKLMFVTGILMMLALFSCDFIEEDTNFIAVNYSTGKHYKIKAELLAVGQYCNVWVEENSGVTENEARKMANVYDRDIYQKMIDAFGFTDTDENGTFNTMDIAGELVDGDGKLCILLLDIKDDYNPPTNNSYVGGYFWAGNFFDQENSNNRSIIFVDVNPGFKKYPEDTYATLAHEMQHLMNFITALYLRWDGESSFNDFLMDTWIDEGLASAAEYIYSGEISQERVNWFNNNGMLRSDGTKYISGLIDKGNNFFVWGNREGNGSDESIYASLDDYATVCLFFQWLRIQDGNDIYKANGIYKRIIQSENYSDSMAVVSNINGYGSWDLLLETWLAANRIKSSNDKFGYKNAVDVKITYAPASASPTSLKLFPGEAVYSPVSNNPNVSASGNIVYKYITSSAVNPGYQANSTLLTYNKNTNIGGEAENGTVTGIAPAASVSAAPVDGSRSVGTYNRPIRIDAGDMLRRKGGNLRNLNSADLRGLSRIKKAAADE